MVTGSDLPPLSSLRQFIDLSSSRQVIRESAAHVSLRLNAFLTDDLPDSERSFTAVISFFENDGRQ